MLLPIPYTEHTIIIMSHSNINSIVGIVGWLLLSLSCTFSIFTLSSVSKIICTIFRILIVNSFFRHDLHRLIHMFRCRHARARTLMAHRRMKNAGTTKSKHPLPLTHMHIACTVHQLCSLSEFSCARTQHVKEYTRSDSRRRQRTND